MFFPKFHDEPSSRPDEQALGPGCAVPALAEPRSFAPQPELGPPGASQVVWPASWAEIAPEAFIQAPPGLRPRPAVALDPELAQLRALIVIPCLDEAPYIAGVIARILDDPGLVD